MRREKEELDRKKIDHEKKLKEVAKTPDIKDTPVVSKTLEQLEKEAEQLKIAEDNLKKKEKNTPWNVDTISQPGFAKTIINKQQPRPNHDNLSEEEKERIMQDFIKKNESLLKKYGMLRKYDDSKRFLSEHHQLVCENTANYLVIWCINLEINKKHELMTHVAHQCIAMQYILELSKQLDIDPRACVGSFFTKIQVAEMEYKKQFDDEVLAFIKRIEKRAQDKYEEALAEQEEEERQARLGPGGLDPVEVFEELPDILKQCFESRDISLLQDAITKLPEEEARYHMKRCVDSGLWIPDASTLETGDEETLEDTTDKSKNNITKAEEEASLKKTIDDLD